MFCFEHWMMRPRGALAAALGPLLWGMEPFDRISVLHLRTGFADDAWRTDFSPADRPAAARSPPQLWAEMEQLYRPCPGARLPPPPSAVPCFVFHRLLLKRAQPGSAAAALLATAPGACVLPAMPAGKAPGPVGALAAVASCAAALAGPSGALFVSGDVPPLAALLEAHSDLGLGLPGRVFHSPGLLGHVVGDSGGGDKEQLESSRLRTLVDFYLLGVADAVVQLGPTSLVETGMSRTKAMFDRTAHVLFDGFDGWGPGGPAEPSRDARQPRSKQRLIMELFRQIEHDLERDHRG